MIRVVLAKPLRVSAGQVTACASGGRSIVAVPICRDRPTLASAVRWRHTDSGGPAFSPTNVFRYTRHRDEFEQLIRYIHTLGFGETRRPIDNRPRTCESTSGDLITRSRPISEERAALRQGRRRWRRGRGSDPARIRSRNSLRAELLVVL